MLKKSLSYLCLVSLSYLGKEGVSAFTFSSRIGTQYSLNQVSNAKKNDNAKTSLQLFNFGSSGSQTTLDKEATSTALDLYLKIYANKSCNKGEGSLTRTFREMCKVGRNEIFILYGMIKYNIMNHDLPSFHKCYVYFGFFFYMKGLWNRQCT